LRGDVAKHRLLASKTSSIRSPHFAVGSWLCSDYSGKDLIHVSSHNRPSRVAQNHDGDRAFSEILLEVDIFVGCMQQVKRGFLRRFQKFTIAQGIPTKVLCLMDGVTLENETKGRGRAVVKKNAHLAMDRSLKAARSKIQDRCDLFPRQVEPLHNLFNGGSRFEILEDDGDGHARAAEDPGTTYLSRDAFDRRTLRPIQRGH